MRSLICSPLRIHARVEVGCVEAVNIVIKWTPENLHIHLCMRDRITSNEKEALLRFAFSEIST